MNSPHTGCSTPLSPTELQKPEERSEDRSSLVRSPRSLQVGRRFEWVQSGRSHAQWMTKTTLSTSRVYEEKTVSEVDDKKLSLENKSLRTFRPSLRVVFSVSREVHCPQGGPPPSPLCPHRSFGVPGIDVVSLVPPPSPSPTCPRAPVWSPTCTFRFPHSGWVPFRVHHDPRAREARTNVRYPTWVEGAPPGPDTFS